MNTRTHLLALPRELRDAIYYHYVAVEGGYVYNPQSGKMIGSDGKLIDLRLMLACKTIAQEMKGIAFSQNIINFSTTYSEDLRLCAGRFGSLMRGLHTIEAEMLHNASSCITVDVIDQVTREYPQFSQILNSLGKDPDLTHSLRDILPKRRHSWGEAPSLFRKFVTRTLELMLDLPGFDSIPMEYKIHNASPDPRALLSLSHIPWKIPLETELDQVVDVIGTASREFEPGYWKPTDCSKWRFSAATVAIKFLQSIPKAVSNQIRRIVLSEDRQSVAYPECHGQGLIPFCQENPFLRVERRVSLWHNVFLDDPKLPSPDERFMRGFFRLTANRVSKPVALWMVEANALLLAGMPQGSFALTLDGDPTPDKTTEVFQVVHKDAAWQSALNEAYRRDLIVKPTYFQRRKNQCYQFEAFPQLLKEVIHGSSLIRCNFDPGNLVDVEQIIDKHREWNADDWHAAWTTHHLYSFATEPPLPPWKDILSEDVLL